MTRNLNLDALRSFLVFADKLNFTHAAEELHISQPALHMKIQELGESLRLPLYRKVGRRLELTEQGRLLARFSRELSERTETFMDELYSGTASHPVTLAAGEGAYLYLLGEPIKEFVGKKKRQIQLLTLNRDGIIEAIQAGKAHLGVAPLETTPHGFESMNLCKVDQMLVMPASHALASKSKLQLKDLSGARLIVPPMGRPHRQMLSTLLQSAGVSWEIAVEANGWQLMLHFVKLGMGLAVVNSNCTIPRGLVAKKLPGLPSVHYHVFNLLGAAQAGAVAELRNIILASQNERVI